MEIIYGLIGFLLGAGCFLLGMYLGRKQTPAPVRHEEEGLTEEKLKRIEKERKALEEEQRAFRQLVGYSADIAYGVERLPSESDETA